MREEDDELDICGRTAGDSGPVVDRKYIGCVHVAGGGEPMFEIGGRAEMKIVRLGGCIHGCGDRRRVFDVDLGHPEVDVAV